MDANPPLLVRWDTKSKHFLRWQTKRVVDAIAGPSATGIIIGTVVNFFVAPILLRVPGATGMMRRKFAVPRPSSSGAKIFFGFAAFEMFVASCVVAAKKPSGKNELPPKECVILPRSAWATSSASKHPPSTAADHLVKDFVKPPTDLEIEAVAREKLLALSKTDLAVKVDLFHQCVGIAGGYTGMRMGARAFETIMAQTPRTFESIVQALVPETKAVWLIALAVMASGYAASRSAMEAERDEFGREPVLAANH